MIDTVTLWHETNEADNALKALTGKFVRTNEDTGEVWHTGNLENLKVKVKGQGVSVNGSLSRFFYGNNAISLTRDTTKQALEKVSDNLHLPMEQAKVYRLDIVQNLVMEKPIIAYMPQLIDAPYLKRDLYAGGEGVLFRNGQHALSFYDKQKELTKKHKPIPAIYAGKNVLRYEDRFFRKVSEQLKKEVLIASDLFEETFCAQALKKWGADYFLIKKIRKECVIKMQGVKELEKSLAIFGLKEFGGQEKILGLLKSEKEQKNITKMQYQRLKQKVFELSVAQNPEEITDDINELDEKIRQAVANYQ